MRILINNVGAGGRPFWVPFSEQKDNVRKMLDVDGLFTTEITRCLLPFLIERAPGLIINIGSFASDAPCPYISVLSGAKAYNKAWSRSLNLEMRLEGYDIKAVHVLVGMVATVRPKFFKVSLKSTLILICLIIGKRRSHAELHGTESKTNGKQHARYHRVW